VGKGRRRLVLYGQPSSVLSGINKCPLYTLSYTGKEKAASNRSKEAIDRD